MNTEANHVERETMSSNEVLARLNCSLRMLESEDEYLFRHNLNERTLTHKLAEYLQRHFDGWHVDCEYNRDGIKDGEDQKKLVRLWDCKRSDDEDGCTVFPDVIVHQRGKTADNGGNLLVIEAKKLPSSSSKENQRCERDKLKLRLYRRELKYQHTAFVAFVIDLATCHLQFDPE